MQSFEAAQQLSEALRNTLRSRDVISTAKGIMIARDGVDEETALAMLMASSRRKNKPLRELAHALVRASVRHRR